MCQSSCLCVVHCLLKEERQEQLPLMEANEDRLGESLAILGMFRRRTLVLCQSGARSDLSRKDAFALMQATVESVQSPPHSRVPCGGGGFGR